MWLSLIINIIVNNNNNNNNIFKKIEKKNEVANYISSTHYNLRHSNMQKTSWKIIMHNKMTMYITQEV